MDLLDEGRDRRAPTPPAPDRQPTDQQPLTEGYSPGAVALAQKEGYLENGARHAGAKGPWYRTRWGVTAIVIVIILIIGAIVGGVVGGTHHSSHKSNGGNSSVSTTGNPNSNNGTNNGTIGGSGGGGGGGGGGGDGNSSVTSGSGPNPTSTSGAAGPQRPSAVSPQQGTSSPQIAPTGGQT